MAKSRSNVWLESWMKLYLLRHGVANWPDWQGSDDQRPLTKKGKEETKRVAEYLSRHGIKPNVILSSPLPRAAQTAQLVAKELDLQIIEEPALAPGFDKEKLAELLSEYDGKDIMIVGHGPDFNALIANLAGAKVNVPKAGLARLDVADPSELRAQLTWLLSPKLMR
jgi:phosphohistidine phosphatase